MNKKIEMGLFFMLLTGVSFFLYSATIRFQWELFPNVPKYAVCMIMLITLICELLIAYVVEIVAKKVFPNVEG